LVGLCRFGAVGLIGKALKFRIRKSLRLDVREIGRFHRSGGCALFSHTLPHCQWGTQYIDITKENLLIPISPEFSKFGGGGAAPCGARRERERVHDKFSISENNGDGGEARQITNVHARFASALAGGCGGDDETVAEPRLGDNLAGY
jgi:hypothetical protein